MGEGGVPVADVVVRIRAESLRGATGSVETDARREWEQGHRGTWEEFKEAIRHGWDKVRGRR